MSTLVIGDVHGCAEELSQLVSLVAPKRLVLVGDAYTKGPDPVGVHRQIVDTGADVVRGNHDQRLLDAKAGRRPGDQHAHEVVEALERADPHAIGAIAGWPLWIEVGRYLVTHAALHPSGDPARTSEQTHLSLRRWPSDALHDPFWWEVYRGPPVIFGHDARRGFVRRDRGGEPWVIGLDTGCVYGGSLTGWVVEEARRVSVPALKAWCRVSGGGEGAPTGSPSGRSPT